MLAALIGACVSLSVARRQFSANVIASPRSSLSSARPRPSSATRRRTGAAGVGPVRDNPQLAEKLEKTLLAIAQIQLLTNAAEPDHQALNAAI